MQVISKAEAKKLKKQWNSRSKTEAKEFNNNLENAINSLNKKGYNIKKKRSD